ncbi:MAG: hypothetical protein FJ335_00995 [Sphingomonadales bacterium]|nr:hypothetical protein [Sphingomonadales bacterium]
MITAAIFRQQALARAAAGDDAGAARLFDQALATFPRDAALANTVGTFHANAGRPAEALTMYDRALAIQPTLHEAAINRCVMLSKMGRSKEAASYLRDRENSISHVPRYWTTRGAAELASGTPVAAGASYDTALVHDPRNARALAGRAQASLDLGEDRSVNDHERALKLSPNDPYLLLGLARAMNAAARRNDALMIVRPLAQRLPNWLEAQEFYADLRWAAGDRQQFTDHYRLAAEQSPSPALFQSWAAMLSGVDQPQEAATILARARQRWPSDSNLALAQSIAWGEAGEHGRAEAIFDHFGRSEPDWQIAEARHRLTCGDPQHAETLLDQALRAVPDDVNAWSLRDIAWRLAGDDRHEWLHGQPGLICFASLGLSETELSDTRQILDELHDRSSTPIGQSVKRGSQTRGALFHRDERAINRFEEAIKDMLETYRQGLPSLDPAHPLLKHRRSIWTLSGSWSIRLDGVGHHAPHIHPRGIVSSASYIRVPQHVDVAEKPGWLELGRPPGKMGVDLPPIAEIKPTEGWCALFPSTLFHGTRPIDSGRRMTIAFDVTAA